MCLSRLLSITSDALKSRYEKLPPTGNTPGFRSFTESTLRRASGFALQAACLAAPELQRDAPFTQRLRCLHFTSRRSRPECPGEWTVSTLCTAGAGLSVRSTRRDPADLASLDRSRHRTTSGCTQPAYECELWGPPLKRERGCEQQHAAPVLLQLSSDKPWLSPSLCGPCNF